MDLIALTRGPLPPDHEASGIPLQPIVDTAPEIWMLGSSRYGGSLAAHLGIRFAFAHFINAHGGHEVARDYRAAIQARRRPATPLRRRRVRDLRRHREPKRRAT